MPKAQKQADKRADPRTVRSRQALAGALLALIKVGNKRPTAPQVAEQAGLSERLVYHHFKDMPSLFAEASRQQEVVVRPIFEDVLFEGSFEARRDHLTESRARVFELIVPTRTHLLHYAYTDPLIEQHLRAVATEEAAQLSQIFARELSRLPTAARKLCEANVHQLVSFPSWQGLRTRSGLSVARARAALGYGLTALFHDASA